MIFGLRDEGSLYVVIILLVLIVIGLEVARRKVSSPGFQVTAVGVAAAALVGLIVIAVWYFAVYDTAGGRCSRGDLGACLVLEAQQLQR